MEHERVLSRLGFFSYRAGSGRGQLFRKISLPGVRVIVRGETAIIESNIEAKKGEWFEAKRFIDPEELRTELTKKIEEQEREE